MALLFLGLQWTREQVGVHLLSHRQEAFTLALPLPLWGADNLQLNRVCSVMIPTWKSVWPLNDGYSFCAWLSISSNKDVLPLNRGRRSLPPEQATIRPHLFRFVHTHVAGPRDLSAWARLWTILSKLTLPPFPPLVSPATTVAAWNCSSCRSIWSFSRGKAKTSMPGSSSITASRRSDGASHTALFAPTQRPFTTMHCLLTTRAGPVQVLRCSGPHLPLLAAQRGLALRQWSAGGATVSHLPQDRRTGHFFFIIWFCP